MNSSVLKAADILRRGGLVAIPTETVYGLAADATCELAVRQIFAVKGRPSHHPLIVHLPDVASIRPWVAEFPPAAEKLAHAFWPGPLTLIFKKSDLASPVVTGEQNTVGIRVPRHALTLELLREVKTGLAAPSANRFGGVSPTTAQHVQKDLGALIPYILDGGPCLVGVESTIVDVSREVPAILRPGGVPQEDIERVLGHSVSLEKKPTSVRASGMLESHYAPKAGVLLVEENQVASVTQKCLHEGKKVAAWVEMSTALPSLVTRFDLPKNPLERARELYATLRLIDATGVDVIVTTLPKETGLDAAVRDRLQRAAAPRQDQ